MEPNEEVCLCFHVSKRKVLNYLRVERPQRAGQLADCFGAGTGCGWCRPYLEQLFEESLQPGVQPQGLPTRSDYARMRTKYLGKA